MSVMAVRNYTYQRILVARQDAAPEGGLFCFDPILRECGSSGFSGGDLAQDFAPQISVVITLVSYFAVSQHTRCRHQGDFLTQAGFLVNFERR